MRTRFMLAPSLTITIAAIVLVLVATPVVLASTFKLKETFGSTGQPSFEKPVALAVDQANGDLLVVDVEANTISRFKADGTPDDFSALAGNTIDGKTGADETPQHGLSFGLGNPREIQVAIDNSGGSTKGDIYVSQIGAKVVDVFASSGQYLGQLTASKEGFLDEACGVATDPFGNVYVGDFSGHIHKYTPAANPVSDTDNTANFAFESNCHIVAGAGPTSGLIFANREFGSEPVKLDSTTGAEQCVVTPEESVAIAVDPVTGALFNATENQVNEFSGACEAKPKPVASFSPGAGITGIAADPVSGDVYVARAGSSTIAVWEPVLLPEANTEAASGVGGESVVLHGTVNAAGGPEASCEFQYIAAEAKVGTPFEGAKNVPCVPAGPFTGSGSEPVSAEVKGLDPGTAYSFRVVASSVNGSAPGESLGFHTVGPALREQGVSQVTASTARIGGLVDPNGLATGFQVQYVSETDFLRNGYAEAVSVPVSPREVGAGTLFVGVVQELAGLEPDTAYHFRLVVDNAAFTVQGPDETFVTFALPGTLLPDGRAYEMVSPSHKAGEVIPPEPGGNLNHVCNECFPLAVTMPMQSAPDGESVLYEGQPFTGGLAAGGNEYVADRGTGGWSSRSVSDSLITGTYEGFSSDLSRSVLYQVQPALSAEAPTRGGVAFANLYLRAADGSLRPLVSEEPPHRSPGTEASDQFRIVYAGANAGSASVGAFTHVIFEANDTLTPEAPEAEVGEECTLEEKTTEGAAHCDLYEWSDGEVRLVNVLPDGGVTGHAVIGSGRLLAGPDDGPDVDRAISADGGRVFWSTEETGQVYVRVDGERTLEVPGPGSCKHSVPLQERACFVTASVDGAMVLLSDGEMFKLDEAGDAYERVADLTVDEGNVHQGGFQGILGAGQDLSKVYFVDTKSLTGEGENANGERARDGAFNLYAWSRGASPSEDRTVFVGVLLEADNRLGLVGRYGDWKAAPPSRTAQVSPDGSYLAFMSVASLTGYDSRLLGGGECRLSEPEACREVFEYSALSGRLVCASCNPSGERPLGGSSLSLLRPGQPAFAPYPQPGNLSSAGHGRLFFESQDVLSAQDTNGSVQDVYEWEPDNVGSCTRLAGCVFLISSGHGANASVFMDSTPSGDDAFFMTREQLLPEDEDQQFDLYDARVGGGTARGEVAPCGGETCRGPFASAPAVQAVGSSVFNGLGNFALSLVPPVGVRPRVLSRAQRLAVALRACARKPRSKRGACRTLARKRYGSVSRVGTVRSRSIKGGK